MNKFLSRVLCVLAASLPLLIAGAVPALGQTYGRDDNREIKPPFGLGWGETAERLERLLTGAKARIVNRRILDDEREAWDVDGLVQTGLRRTVFYFKRGELVEVELQYQKDDWTQAKYDEFMGQVRRRIEQRYGAGQQIIRKTEPEGTVMQTIVGYKWNLNNTALELFYYSAQDSQHVFRTMSVHYKGQ
ncbi:MAG: hypothetical protein EOP84_14225 [Verrucomicrobiaceae bacterium]|nr:MAG: hypothetical protein EOP84_14225 [Verrucomicrobiaceae bacterium]